MKTGGYCLFETALGTCGIAWREAEGEGGPPAVTRLQLPDGSAAATEARIACGRGARGPAAPPPQIVALIDKVRQHLSGQPQDFRQVLLDLGGLDSFACQVYAAAREIPAGQTRTYGELARAIGQPGAAQAVGRALGGNPVPIIIPCHRIVAAGGKPGGFSAYGGLTTKARLLEIEGAALTPAGASLTFDFERPGED